MSASQTHENQATGAQPLLTEQELEIMKVVWDLEKATVREVHEVLAARRKVAYTTVMTMMTILEGKGHLTRRRDGRAFVYKPTRPQGQVISGMVDDFLSRVFGGSARPLLVSLVRDRKVSAKDLDEISRLIEEAES